MENTTKVLLSKWLIFISVFVAISGEIYQEVLTDVYPNLTKVDPHSTALGVFGIFMCAIFVTGLFLGSRGLGAPLTVGLFFKLLFSSPTKYIFVPYLILSAIGIIYLVFFWA